MLTSTVPRSHSYASLAASMVFDTFIKMRESEQRQEVFVEEVAQIARIVHSKEEDGRRLPIARHGIVRDARFQSERPAKPAGRQRLRR